MECLTQYPFCTGDYVENINKDKGFITEINKETSTATVQSVIGNVSSKFNFNQIKKYPSLETGNKGHHNPTQTTNQLMPTPLPLPPSQYHHHHVLNWSDLRWHSNPVKIGFMENKNKIHYSSISSRMKTKKRVG